MSKLRWKNLLCVNRSLTESIIQQKTPWLKHFTLSPNTRWTVNMQWNHTGSCRNINTALCHQRKHNKKEAHASEAVMTHLMTGADTAKFTQQLLLQFTGDLYEWLPALPSFLLKGFERHRFSYHQPTTYMIRPHCRRARWVLSHCLIAVFFFFVREKSQQLRVLVFYCQSKVLTPYTVPTLVLHKMYICKTHIEIEQNSTENVNHTFQINITAEHL